jgi:hypothetical protein
MNIKRNQRAIAKMSILLSFSTKWHLGSEGHLQMTKRQSSKRRTREKRALAVMERNPALLKGLGYLRPLLK